MTDRDSKLREVLERAVPPVTDRRPDWDDVVRRAEPEDGRDGARVVRLRATRRRVWYALAAAALLTVLVVNPAFGLGPRLVDWFEGSPAPADVKKSFATFNENPPVIDASGKVVAAFEREGPRVIAEKARGVTAIETEDGPVYLWAAPTTSGSWCVYAQSRNEGEEPSGAAGCPFEEVEEGYGDALFTSVSSNDDEDDLRWLLFGRADPPIRSLELRFADGSAEPVPLVDRFFLYEEPAEREATALVGRDAAGRIVAREPMPSPNLP